jgi:hypothetical protein
VPVRRVVTTCIALVMASGARCRTPNPFLRRVARELGHGRPTAQVVADRAWIPIDIGDAEASLITRQSTSLRLDHEHEVTLDCAHPGCVDTACAFSR